MEKTKIIKLNFGVAGSVKKSLSVLNTIIQLQKITNETTNILASLLENNLITPEDFKKNIRLILNNQKIVSKILQKEHPAIKEHIHNIKKI